MARFATIDFVFRIALRMCSNWVRATTGLAALTRASLYVASIFLAIALPVQAADDPGAFGWVRMFSALTFIEEETEWVGLQVTLLPYHDRAASLPTALKVLWQTGSGRLDEPLMLNAELTGSPGAPGWKLQVPATSEFEGEWTLQFEGDILRARGPRDLEFDLREVRFSFR